MARLYHYVVNYELITLLGDILITSDYMFFDLLNVFAHSVNHRLHCAKLRAVYS